MANDALNDRMDDASVDLQWNGTWDELKGKAKRLWGTLTDDDVDVAEGNVQEFFGKVQKSTGETIEDIRAKLFDSPDAK